MALQLSITTDQGFVAAEAYVVIENISYNKQIDNRANCMAMKYKDAASRDAENQPFDNTSFIFTYDVNSVDSIVVQAYNVLKAMDEMAGSIDV